MIVPGYDMRATLQDGPAWTLVRALRAPDGLPVLLKAGSTDRPGAAAALRREGELLASLHVEGLARPLGVADSPQGPVLVLADPGGEPLSRAGLAPPLPLETALGAGAQLAGAVAALHQRDLVMRTLSAAGVLLDPATGRATLVDVSRACRPASLQQAAHLGEIEGDPSYLAPEQTGRMNREVDHRADLYALGVLLYRMLTGRLPFVGADLVELVHAHVARQPDPPADVTPGVPPRVSELVLRLLAKTAEERYQSAVGVRADLLAALAEWRATGRVERLVLGTRDVADHFVLPQHIYGRARETADLVAAFGRACDGGTELVMVAGYAGIGKTTLIRELYRPLVRQRGYFIAGKFDQVARVPYGAFIQALHALVRQLLTEGEAELADWRARLGAALGGGAAVLAEVVPELALIVGPQPPPPPLNPVETQNRFRVALQDFFRVLATPEHPLVVFLDDLQWADAATLNLLDPLLTAADLRWLLLIGAYRDNEVDGAHPLVRVVGDLEARGVAVRTLALGPLAAPEVTQLVQDALHADAPTAEPLARLVLTKTEGNPFFVRQFLQALREADLLTFDYAGNRWTYRLEAVAAAGMTDNVVDLMARKIRRLAPEAQQALTLASCIGSRFDLDTLAVVSQQPAEAAAGLLEPALATGLVRRASGTHVEFLHDRVQQAAYAMIPPEDRPAVHLTVGRLLLGRRDRAVTADDLFDVLQHLNRGRDLVTATDERLRIAGLDLAAGRRAKTATAYQAALGFLGAGLDLMRGGDWDREYDLTFALHLEAAECEYMAGSEERADRHVDELLERARDRRDRAAAYSLQIVHNEYLLRYRDAIAAGSEALSLFALAIPATPAERARELAEDQEAIDRLIGSNPLDAVAALPVTTDPDDRTVMQLLARLHTPCYLSGDKTLTLLNTARMVRRSLERGSTEESALAYVLYAMHVGQIQGDFARAHEFGLLALRLNDRLYDAGIRARVMMNFSWAVTIWRQPFAASFPYTRETVRLANQTGLFTDAAYALFNEAYLTLLASPRLATLREAADAAVTHCRRVRMPAFADAPQVVLQWGLALQGKTAAPTSLDGAGFSEDAYLAAHAGQSLFEMFFRVAKLAVQCTFGEYADACATALEAERAIRDYTGTIWDELRVFYHAVALASLEPAPADEAFAARRATLAALERRLAWWAENAPENFRAQHRIVAAELARLEGRDPEAAALYEAAIDAGAEQACPRELALAHELCARFWQRRGQVRTAAAFLAEARRAYVLWGATAKVAQLDRAGPDNRPVPLAEPAPAEPAPAEATPVDAAPRPVSSGEAIDLTTVMKAAQALSAELELPKLLGNLMRIAIENAGAERGSLILEDPEGARIRASGTLDPTVATLREAVRVDQSTDLSPGIVHYVRRTRQSLVLADARREEPYASDPYVIAQQPRSVLCTPMVAQGRLVGTLYLENNLLCGAFTPDRLRVLQLLAAQAAIAIEKAELFAEVTALRDRLEAENVYLREEIGTRHDFEELVGESPALHRVLGQIEQVAPTDTSVLIVGETGTGKELVARAIHRRSRRRDGPLVTVNCGAISPGLVESELFGHEKGAFTGALARKIGRFELADAGTIFLDEIGDLPLDLQVKLLRVLQEGEIARVGATKNIRVSVRVITATHRDLESEVRAGRFREDLYYRLNVFPIRTPALRERKEDIPALVRHLVLKYSAKMGKRIETVPRSTLEALADYGWPGNIRELGNIIERSVIISRGTTLELGEWIGGTPREPASGGGRTLETVEREHIVRVLVQTGWRVSGPGGAARILGIKPTTLEARMQKLGIIRPAAQPRPTTS